MPSTAKSSQVRRLPGRPAPHPVPPRKITPPWSLRNAGGVQVLELAPLKKVAGLVHGFSTRRGGTSKVESGERVLNLGFTGWDTRGKVLKNRDIFKSALGATDALLVPLKQIHSSVVRSYARQPNDPDRGDASLTIAPGLLLGVQTADCVPILLVDTRMRAVAAIHAGWRGTLARIAQKTVGEMGKQFCSEPADIIAALGPAIGGCCYEVGTELVTEFMSQFAGAEEYFNEPFTGEEPNPLQWLNMMPPGHQPPPKNVRFDLRKANRAQLLAAGLAGKNIFVSDLCTACDNDLFFSYRKEGANSGRLLSAIGFRHGSRRAVTDRAKQTKVAGRYTREEMNER